MGNHSSPKPYKLHWLSDGSDVKVSRQALISFEIRKFKDEVLCDVVNLDSCHVLLGWPWQYDRFVKYDGCANVYIATIGTKNPALKPLVTSKPHAKENFLLIEKEIANEMEMEGEGYLLLQVIEESTINATYYS